MQKWIKKIYQDSSPMIQDKAYYSVIIAIIGGLAVIGSGLGDFLNAAYVSTVLKIILLILVASGGTIIFYRQYYIASNILVFSTLILLCLVFVLGENKYISRYDIFVQSFYLIPAYIIVFLIAYHEIQALITIVIGIASLLYTFFSRFLPLAPAIDVSNLIGNLVSSIIVLVLTGAVASLNIRQVKRNMGNLEKKIIEENERTEKLKNIIQSSEESLSIGEILQNNSFKMSALITKMNENMNAVQTNFAHSFQIAQQVHDSSKKLIDSYNNVNMSMNDQVQSIQSTRESVNKMDTTIDSIAGDSSQKVEQLNMLARQFANSKNEIQAFRNLINQVAVSSNNLMEIIEVISDITGKTNLLAMNASIEAVHAGNYGRGFSIVANEIRKLADQSNNNSQLIRKNLDKIRADIKQAESGNEHMVEGISNILSFISNTTTDIQNLLQEMVTLTRESNDIQQHMKTLSEINNLVKQTSERSSHIMSDNADIINKIISSLAETDLTIRYLFSDSKEIQETVVQINEIGKNNLATILDLKKKIEDITKK